MLTDRYGGRAVFSAVMAFSIIPALAIGHVTTFYGLLICGFLIGVALASFSVGVAFTSGWYPPGRQGTALGILLKKSTGSFTLGFVLLGIFAVLCLLVVRPKVFALCLVPPETGSAPRLCSRQRSCPYARSCPAIKAA